MNHPSLGDRIDSNKTPSVALQSKGQVDDQWHCWSAQDLIREFGTDEQHGLTSQQASERLAEYGPNSLPESEQRSILIIFLEQIRGPMIALLVVVAIVSLLLGEYVDAIAVLAIIVLNATLGFLQDYRAERALAALRQLAVPTVKVRRDGNTQELSADELVPGDLLLLEAGDAVAADCRLLSTANLQTQEAALTGESEPVLKQQQPLPTPDVPIADRRNMVFLGTTVSSGRGTGLVTTTGIQSELGQIAKSMQSVQTEPTPLQRRLAELGKTLAVIAIAIVVMVFLMGLVLGESPRLMLLTSLSLAVAIVPEGLPAAATVALAIGARKMAARQALIRRLPAVEALGSVTVICSDKTGTLTQNKMAVTLLDVEGMTHSVHESTHPPLEESSVVQQHSGLSLLLTIGTLCNDSSVTAGNENHQINCVGEPTELAIALAAIRYGFPKTELDDVFPRVSEHAFDSDRKCMTTIHRHTLGLQRDRKWLSGIQEALPIDDDDFLVCTKGALDEILKRSGYVWRDDVPVPLDDELIARIQATQTDFAGQGMRVLGVGFRIVDEFENLDVSEIEQDLIFVGLVAMIDPPRAEASESVRRCREAGIRPIMITGDHALTALSIAKTIGVSEDDEVIEGGKVVTAFEAGAADASVYARVSPQEKLEIVRRLQEQGEIVAMTGDGVNDSPALKKADIGVAMGITGTDVAKESADMVLLDDNFATIVNAVEEGRTVFDNIRKFVKYTMTSNAGELFVMIIGPLLGMPIPLLPLQILWINLVTDGLPGIALAVEPAESNAMTRPPYPPNQRIFDRIMLREIVWIGLLMAITSLFLGYMTWTADEMRDDYWRTLVFTTLTIAQLGNALAIRSSSSTFLEMSIFKNRLLSATVILTLLLQVAVVYFAPLQQVFRTVALSSRDFWLSMLFGSIVFFAIEARKLVYETKSADST